MPDTVLGARLNSLPHSGPEIESQVEGSARGLINGKRGCLSQAFWLQVPCSFIHTHFHCSNLMFLRGTLTEDLRGLSFNDNIGKEIRS